MIVIAQNPKSGAAENDKYQLREAQLRGGSPEQLHASTIRRRRSVKLFGFASGALCASLRFEGGW